MTSPKGPAPQERWLITGATGQLGGHVLAHLCDGAGERQILAVSRRPVPDEIPVLNQPTELARHDKLRRCVERFRPTHIIHAGAITSVGEAYADPQRTRIVNVDATAVLAESAERIQARMVFISTDMVFDGTAAPYDEHASPCPLSVYGQSKVDAERIFNDRPGLVVARLPLMYGMPRIDRQTTFTSQLERLQSGSSQKVFTDEFRTPVCLTDAAAAVVALARSEYTGTIHVAGPERMSRMELVHRCATFLQIPQPSLVPVSRLDIESPEPRAADLSLNGARFARRFPEFVPGPVQTEAITS